MKTSTVSKALDRALEGRRLLDHEFYKRWNAGELSKAELTEYAEQYRHFEAALPQTLSAVAAAMTPEQGRASVEANLADEVGPPSHLDIFDGFLSAAGGSAEASISPAMANLVQAYRNAADAGPVEGLAGVAAYEVQSSDIAITKGGGLRNNYGLSEDQTEFWTLHGELEKDHADWSIEGLAAACDETDAGRVTDAARSVADAWWGFLDERQERAAVLA